MAPSMGDSERFIRDAEEYNRWWNGDDSDLTRVTADVGRSDFYRILERLDRARGGDSDEHRQLGLYGQTGVGKTTLLKRLVASILDDHVCEYDPVQTPDRGYDIVGSVDPRQVLYVPVKDSLYGLEPGEAALTRLEGVLNYFRSRVARRTDQHYLFLDDIDSIDASSSAIRETIDGITTANTFVLTTGNFQSDLGVPTEATHPLLPVKFVDFVEYGHGESSSPDVVESVVDNRHVGGDGDLIKRVRQEFKSATPDLQRAARLFDQLYFETFDESGRESLHQLSREYLRQGGLLHRSRAGAENSRLLERYYELTDKLVRANLESFIYREIARKESVKRPENLLQLCAIAARPDEVESNYQEIADVLGVDRRTVGTYLQTLAEQLVLTESTDYSLQRHRRTRLYLRDPRHVTLLSQRQAHRGFESLTGSLLFQNARFERSLARTVAFDHLKRLRFRSEDPDAEQAIEYYETEAGVVDFIVRYGATVVPFVCTYEPFEADGTDIARTFDPGVGSHADPTAETAATLDVDYEAPCCFLLTDRVPDDTRNDGTLIDTLDDGTSVCRLPLWLFLLVC